MNISQTISHYSKLLKSTSPLLDSELLLSHILIKPKEYLYTYPEKKLTTKQLYNFTTLFKRRQKGEPIAYILGHKEFFGLDYKVNKNVLIPRPETELLVEKVNNFAESKQPLVIIEIGVGSGALIISLAKILKKSQFIATDISAKALTVAKQNAKTHRAKIDFYPGNLLEPLTQLKGLQLTISNYIIVANLPYLETKQRNDQQLSSEPKIAWDGGPDGLKYFRQFFNQISKNKLQPLAIFLEIGYNQANKIKKLAQLALPSYKSQTKKDLCGFDRIISIIK